MHRNSESTDLYLDESVEFYRTDVLVDLITIFCLGGNCG